VPTRSKRPRLRRTPHAARRTRAGFSLLEAVAAVAIVGLTAVGALESVGGNMRTAEKAKRAAEAEALATSRLDFMDLLNDRELQALPDTVEKGTFAAPLNQYTWKTTSTPVSEQAGVYDIRITIEWPTGSYTVRTYEYRRPPLVTRQ
jgi:type II secretory pathway pseudopilin PulG